MLNAAWIIGFALYGLVVALSCRAIIPWLNRYRLVDLENDRTSHTGTVPRGGGLVFVPFLLAALLVSAFNVGGEALWWITYGAIAWFVLIGFAIVSAIDDLKNLNAGVRLTAHILLAIGLVFTLPSQVLPGPFPVSELIIRCCCVLLLVWWVNLFNFMDGIDGLAGVQTLTIACGLAVTFFNSNGVEMEAIASILVALTALAFLTVNWHPARLFMGDAGSITLAAILGFLMLLAAKINAWGVVLILPLYFWLDASSTLAWRLLKREKIWQAHRQHAYQRYVASGYSHSAACYCVIGLNVILFGLAMIEFAPFWIRFCLALVATIALLIYFRSAKPVQKTDFN